MRVRKSNPRVGLSGSKVYGLKSTPFWIC
ncbi:hypothetical protein CR513_42367, partial [Mucuna pruriens]